MSDEEDVKIDQGNSVIYITEQASINWTNEATDAFIELYAESQALFRNRTLKTRRSVFDWISTELAKRCLYYHWTQCENKWKSLKRSFTNRAQKNPYILENPNSTDALLMDIFKKEKNSPIEFAVCNSRDSSLNPDIKIKQDHDDDSVDELVDALVNNDDNYLETLENCTEESEDGKSKITESPSEHAYSSSFQRNNKNNTKETTQIQLKRGIKRHATELDLDLANEVLGLRNDLGQHHKENKEILRHNLVMQEKLVKVLSRMEKQKDETLQLKREEIEKQGLVAQQMKIQNSLLAKLVHHFINRD